MGLFSLEGQMVGKYRVLTALGRGGMAQVYKGYHAQLDRYVAIKVLRSDLLDDSEFLGRFRREAHAVASLRHANIVQVFDFDLQDGLHYMVMELLEGDTLRAKLNECRSQGKRMPLAEILRIVLEVLAGLEYAHREGVIHRDIKPANIMLTRHGQAVLTDFGIAQIVGGTQYTVSGALMGTLNYMAPEQGLKGLCDRRSDIYSLGIVLYELLTGFTPFDADTPLAILMKHLNDPLPLPSQADPSLPSCLEYVVLKALAKEPEDRYQSAGEMILAVRQAEEEINRINLPNLTRNAVFSGAAREQMENRALADDDTESDMAQLQMNKNLTGEWVNRFPKINATTGALGGVAVFLAINFFAALISTVSGKNLWEVGWPFELFGVAALLMMIGWGTQTVWMLVPGLIVFGNAILLSYTTLSGRWQDWAFLGMLEPFIVAVAIYLPKRMSDIQPGERRAGWARVSGSVVTLTAILLSVLTCGLAVVVLNWR